MGCKHSNNAIATNSNSMSTSKNRQHSPAATSASASTSTTADTTATRPTVFNRERVNLESHQLVWLDPNVNNSNESESSITIEDLRKIIDYTKLFDNVEECQQYIVQTKDTTTFLVISEQLGQILIPQIHHLKNIWIIYVYCHNTEYHQPWASHYSKIKQVHTELDQLLNDLNKDVQEYLKHENDGIFSEFGRQDKMTDDLTSWWIPFIDLLCYLPYPEDYRNRLINSLKTYYKDKEEELQVLQEFETTYKPDKAVWWYTRPTFLYHLLNRALRQHNIEVMYLFGFFIQDLYRQLKDEHETFKLTHLKNSTVKLYRGQVMALIEIEKLEEDDYYFIVNSSFFSTSLDRSVSLSFLQSSTTSKELERVLFEIVIDVCQRSRPFADISHLSYFGNKSEFLFMTGTQFMKERGDISYDKNEKIWIIKQKLDYDNHIKHDKDFHGMTERRILKNCITALSYNLDEASPEDIDTIFNELIDLFSSEKWILATKFHSLGLRHQRTELNYTELNDSELNYIAALSNYDQALNIWLEYINDNELNCSFDIGQLHKLIGQIYQYYVDIQDKNRANKHYDLAISYYQSAIEKVATDYEQINIQSQISFVYKYRMEISNDENERIQNNLMAIKYRELTVQNMLKYYLSNDIEIGRCMIHLADLYKSIFKYDDALINYEKALEIVIQDKSDPESYIGICDFIVEIYIKYKNDYNSALKYKLIKHEYTLKENVQKLTDNETEIDWKNEEIAESYIELSNIYIKLHEYKLAYQNLTIAMTLYQKIKLDKKLEKMATIQRKMKTVQSFLKTEKDSANNR
ncbi:unnamed protein product [Didymodactylos carnosus]|uniref:Uncharacterized protein n=2 Tax=Didymodactylos carnosus TaxID=1234261 RepID=A0A815JD43_9BILA|nr:unnamed protein product [Didymodactylos carnosus]CAF4269726.1 unnamed protein product [Didymodactylos carnosus]